ncbi:hypothetical protein JSO54_01710 [Riemerella anatipestifer]|uniref:abortive infection system antitoxin AbiGi family protein n=1 Tax=Riemerella anatipestifer TaxID=34085 RepID=UPI001374FE79|nr:abortive infection system antitoxin AbiGi family protein [Riemerella anatipestifer]MDY3339094.1 abortive infection system antitoxin AbiGi family protein [Riemerella anatipestifer]MDY3520991.1 abortive infection system antitoxin AbiGi family protein [Riemerella anatipestifer]MDY3533248.1 abortive infection system antitoxin AbiGi family protein [Riemerella anatipestifer]MDY3535286.1 abortive infection system antitoxin AbiGi family protein [Riemerella anatipestifer]
MKFEQKKVEHIFHYTKTFELLKKILNNGFIPSYCFEIVGDFKYYIPMVSFCNIPLQDVHLFARYGEYGIGMNLDWAVKKSISPVVYTHENTVFKNLHYDINTIQIVNMLKQMIPDTLNDILGGEKVEKDYSSLDYLISEINKITVPTIQHFKNWKTEYKEKQIITYHEREWRFIPQLESDYEKIVDERSKLFKKIQNNEFRKKPHFPEYPLVIENIKYILIKNKNQREIILKILSKKFGKENVVNSILKENLNILTFSSIKNDF